MKIGIITLPLHTNYGGILQAYALQTVLERMGHTASIISVEQKGYKKPTVLDVVKRLILKACGKNLIVFAEKYYHKQYPNISKNIRPFLENKIHSDYYRSLEDIPTDVYDAIVVGSDQIWRKKYVSKIGDAFLLFAKDWNNLTRLSYAASFGLDYLEYTQEDISTCTELLTHFDGISVREASGVEICKKEFAAKAYLVLDPTMLLSKEDYIKLIMDRGVELDKSSLLMHYILNESELASLLINNISSSQSLAVLNLDEVRLRPDTPTEKLEKVSIEDWLNGFRCADFIVTDSFHACVFSMVFNKPFVVIGNKSRGMARFESLLETFNQRFRLVSSLEEFQLKRDLIMCPPNQNERIDLLAKESLNFLNNTLK